MDQSLGLKAVILGASGAVGRELVKELLASPNWVEVHIIVRRKLEQWDSIENKQKLQITLVDSLDILEQSEQWKFLNYNTMFCCLGSRVQEGDAVFTKIELQYPQYGAKIAQLNKIPHFSLVSALGADRSSMFIFKRVKGQVEDAIVNFKFPMTTIMRPGGILNRDNDRRCIETIAKYIPFIPKIECTALAKAVRIEAEHVLQAPVPEQPRFILYTHDQILAILQ